MRGKFTEDALLTVTKRIHEYNILNLNKTTGLFIDLIKTLDLVDHTILLGKLDAIGIRGKNLNFY